MFIVLITLIAGFGGFLLGFDSTMMANIHDEVCQYLHLSNWQWSQIVGVSLFGGIFGIPLSGFFADRISRRLLLQIVALSYIISILSCASAFSFSSLLIGRFFSGVCMGIAAYATPLFIAEMAPPKHRGALFLINGLALTLGQAMAYFIGYLLHNDSIDSWPYLLMLASFPSVVLLIGMQFIPDAPSWIIKKKGYEPTRILLKKIRSRDHNIERELSILNKNLVQPKIPYSSLVKKPIFYVLLIGTVLGISQQLSGINCILYYGPMLFEAAGFVPVQNAILATFCIGAVNFIFTIITLLCVDRLGRRRLLLTGTFIAAGSLFIINGLFNNFINQKIIILLFFCFYVAGYCISVGSLFWVIISEIYPIQVRGLAMSIATVMQYLVNFIISLYFLSVYQEIHQLIFSLFGVACIIAFLLVYFFVPETTGLALEQIEERLMMGHKIREIGQPLSK